MKIIVPIGQDLGIDTEGAFHIGVGSSVTGVSAREYIAWVAAHARLDLHAELAFTRARLAETAQLPDFGLSNPVPEIESLERLGLLVEFDPRAPEGFFSRHRLIATGEGMGAVVDTNHPGGLAVGRNGEIYAWLPRGIYYLWGSSDGAHTLWDSCAALIKESDGQLQSADDIAWRFAEHLPLLVASRCARLDLERTN